MKRFCKIFILSFSLILLANYANAQDLGQVANNIQGPFDVVASVFVKVSLLIGFGLIIASLVRYNDFRRNSVQTRLSTPIFLFIIGLALVLLPLLTSHSISAKSAGQHVEQTNSQ